MANTEELWQVSEFGRYRMSREYYMTGLTLYTR